MDDVKLAEIISLINELTPDEMEFIHTVLLAMSGLRDEEKKGR